MVFIAFLTATILLVAFTLLPLWRCEAWWVRALDFPRLQLSFISLLVIVLESVLLEWTLLSTWCLVGIALFCFVYQAWWIAPYTPLFPVEVKSTANVDRQRMIRIITANVLTPNRDAKTLIDQVRENEPDILVTLESDDWWQSKLDTLETDYPFTIKCPQDNLYGMHVYSRLPLSDSHIEYLVEPDIPSMHTLVRLPAGNLIRVHFLHPAPPSPTENEKSAERDAELIVVAKSVANAERPVIVTGDLNDVAWSETTRLFRKISGLLDPRVGRGMFNSFHAGFWFIRWPLDHLFHSSHFTVSSLRRLRRFGSDHFAILTELLFESDPSTGQKGLEADRDDIALADSKIKDQGVSREDVPQPGRPR